MELTFKQEQGLRIILNRLRNNEKYTVISGFAGTGKSTLVKFAIDAMDIDEDLVAYATFTGKAAEVLRKKGNPGACTLHRLLYDHFPRPDGGFFRKPKPVLDQRVIVVDEVSMVPQSMIDLLLSHRVYVIFLGDPFQLPQIESKEENHMLDHPHIFLDEIMRQAAESEIIQLTMKIRNKESINLFQGNEVQILPKKDLFMDMYHWADQILVAKNETRHRVNSEIRQSLGYEGPPKDGERIICLKNYWDDVTAMGDALVNGTTGTLRNPYESFVRIPGYIKNDRRDLPLIVGDFVPDGSDACFESVNMDKELIMTGKECIDWRVRYQLGKLKDKIGDIVPKEFAFAYAITCHKAQGSEWNKVLVIEEKMAFETPESHARWLYTACTRAADKLVLIR